MDKVTFNCSPLGRRPVRTGLGRLISELDIRGQTARKRALVLKPADALTNIELTQSRRHKIQVNLEKKGGNMAINHNMVWRTIRQDVKNFGVLRTLYDIT